MKNLLNLQRTCDDTIMFLKKRERVLNFDDISASVEACIKRTFSLTHFCQLLSAVPTLYTYEWRKVSGSSKQILVIDVSDEDFKTTECRVKRTNALRSVFLKITEEYHTNFLKKLVSKRPALKDYLSDFDPIAHKSWYHEFDPHDVSHAPQIKPVSLSDKPCAARRTESISDFLKRNRSSQKKESFTKFSMLS